MYKPDRKILAELKRYDKNLNAEWDTFKQRWVLPCNNLPIMVVQNDDRSFRPLDERVLTQVRIADAYRYKDTTALIKEIYQHNHRITAKERERMSDYVQQVAKEDLYRCFHGGASINGWGPGTVDRSVD